MSSATTLTTGKHWTGPRGGTTGKITPNLKLAKHMFVFFFVAVLQVSC